MADVVRRTRASCSSVGWESSIRLSRLKERLRNVVLSGNNVIFAIDFSSSNSSAGRSSFGGRCLHAVNQGDPNPYMMAIAMIGCTISNLDEGKGHPAFLGFGAGDQPSVFSLGPSAGSFRTEVEDGLATYKLIAPYLTLGYSSSYGAVIDAAAAIVEEDGFHVLIIVTCGRGSDNRSVDADDTIQALKRASKCPLSIVFVVVGDGPCSGVHNLRMRLGIDSSPEAQIALSNTTVVNFTEVYSKPLNIGEKVVEFASACLDDLPDQYRCFRERCLLSRDGRASGKAHARVPPCNLGREEMAAVARWTVFSCGSVMSYGPYSSTYKVRPGGSSGSSSSGGGGGSGGGRGSGYVDEEDEYYLSLSLQQDRKQKQPWSPSVQRAGQAAATVSRIAGAGATFRDHDRPSSSPSAQGGASSSQQIERICGICYAATPTAQFTDCQHRTCLSCAKAIRSWSKKGKMVCPFCRKPVKGWTNLTRG